MLKNLPHGIVDQTALQRKTDYLFRISLKALIRNESGGVLVVKEAGRTWWDLPGGGMDHGEDIKLALARELKEEVNLEGDFSYAILAVDSPSFLAHANVWQLRLIFEVVPEVITFNPGIEADEVLFINPETLKNSENLAEKNVYQYANTVS